MRGGRSHRLPVVEAEAGTGAMTKMTPLVRHPVIRGGQWWEVGGAVRRWEPPIVGGGEWGRGQQRRGASRKGSRASQMCNPSRVKGVEGLTREWW